MMCYSGCRYSSIASAAVLCLLPVGGSAQQNLSGPSKANTPPKPRGVTPRKPDGHPDLSGVGMG